MTKLHAEAAKSEEKTKSSLVSLPKRRRKENKQAETSLLAELQKS